MEQPTPTSRRIARVLARTLLALVFVFFGAELIVGTARDWAFPYLNLYAADADYGVRLEPDASTALRSRQGRVSDIATNGLGFRGGDWLPAPSQAPVPGRVVLLGDSQVFGYGVDEVAAMSARLQVHLSEGLGAPVEVLNAATPTWGPHEYQRALAELAPIYRPQTVVYVANVANDWFDAAVPNRRRTTERDGWAHFLRPDDPPPAAFPGRRWLMGKSQLVYAVRALLADRSGLPPTAVTGAGRLLSQIEVLAAPRQGFRSRMAPHVLAARDTCERLGCRLVLAILPLDVQAHPAERHKYQAPPTDVTPVSRLAADLLADAATAEVPAADLLPALTAASPGAFLPDDYHLSPAGHDVVARTLARLILRDASSPITEVSAR